MKKLAFDQLHRDKAVVIEKAGKIYETIIVSTTRGHLGIREFRTDTGEVFNYDETNIYELSPEMRTEALLSGELINKRKKFTPE